MELIKVKKNKKTNFMLRISQQEAWSLVKSLSSQVLSGSPNTGRNEYTTTDGEYFSVAVVEKPKVDLAAWRDSFKKKRAKGLPDSCG